MLAATTIALLITVGLALVRAMLGPTLFDRLQAANTVGTCAMLLLAVLGFLAGRPEFLDLALVYGLLNAVGVFAVLKFVRQGDLGEASEVTEAGEMNEMSEMNEAGQIDAPVIRKAGER